MTTETKQMPSEREIEAVNVESLRLIAEEFRKLEAPYKDRGDPRGLGLGARAYCVECAADEIERARAILSRLPAAGGGLSNDDKHYLGAIKLRLENLYELLEEPRVREQISDEVSWIEEKMGSAP